jgi:uncharacterized membrane protein YphA (DoxX/SURF4 family)
MSAGSVGVGDVPASQRRPTLQRLFSTFPARWPGVGLLVLRTAVGLTAVVEGGAYVGTDAAPAGALAGLLLAASGASLLAGFLTPVAAAVVGSCLTGLGLSSLPVPTRHVFDDSLAIAFVVIVALALVLLGPGAYSLDSYLFGRREIVIAARPRA